MRVLYLQQHFSTASGEGGIRGYNLMRTLVARGHDVTVVCGHSWRDQTLQGDTTKRVEIREVDGFRLVRLGVFYSNRQSFLTRIGAFLMFALLATREVLRRPVDIVFASSTPLTISIPAVLGRWLRGVPYVFEVRDLWPDLPIEMGVIRNPLVKRALYWWERLVYRNAWRLVALAPGIRDSIIRKAGVDPSRVIMIPNGSDTENLRPGVSVEQRRLPREDGELLFGYTGTFGLANGLDAVLDAAAVLKRRGGSRARFVLIGDGRERERLQRRVHEEGLTSVTFSGLFNKREYNRVLNELHVGMQILQNIPGFYWGTSPNKFFDYLAAGRPVLVNYPGWMAELVTTNGCGVAVPPDDADAFADAVTLLERQSESVAAMGQAARALAEREFSQQRILVDLAMFIEEGFAERMRGVHVRAST